MAAGEGEWRGQEFRYFPCLPYSPRIKHFPYFPQISQIGAQITQI